MDNNNNKARMAALSAYQQKMGRTPRTPRDRASSLGDPSAPPPEQDNSIEAVPGKLLKGIGDTLTAAGRGQVNPTTGAAQTSEEARRARQTQPVPMSGAPQVEVEINPTGEEGEEEGGEMEATDGMGNQLPSQRQLMQDVENSQREPQRRPWMRQRG